MLKELGKRGEIVFLAENCEVVKIESRKELREILERIAGRK